MLLLIVSNVSLGVMGAAMPESDLHTARWTLPPAAHSQRASAIFTVIGVRGRGAGGGGSQIRAKQWGKSGQSKKKQNYV